MTNVVNAAVVGINSPKVDSVAQTNQTITYHTGTPLSTIMTQQETTDSQATKSTKHGDSDDTRDRTDEELKHSRMLCKRHNLFYLPLPKYLRLIIILFVDYHYLDIILSFLMFPIDVKIPY